MTQTILLTGAGSGIARAAALRLAKQGHRVIATTHTKQQATALLDAARADGLSLESFKLDITNPEDIAHAASFPVDVLVNSAAIGESGPLSEVPLDRVRDGLEVNVVGTLAVIQAFVPRLLAKKQGRIVIIGSTAGRVVLPYLGPYHLTKYAVEAMADALRMELAPHGVRVSLIEPGLILTGFNERMAETKYAWLRSSSAYASDLPRMRAHDAALPSRSFGTEEVVDAIVHAIESPRPKTRYVAPRSYGRSMLLAKLVPDWIKDRVMRRFAGLS